MTKSEQEKLLEVLSGLTFAVETVNGNIQRLLEIAKILDERLTRLEGRK